MVCKVFGLACVAALSACGGTGDAAAPGTCGFSGSLPKVASTPSEDTPVETQAEAAGRALLDAFLRPYLLGHATVYRGTFTAHDNQGVLGQYPVGGTAPSKDQYVPPSQAIASLVTSGGDEVLTVHSLIAHKYVVFSQVSSDTSGTTDVGIILADDEQGGNTGTCSGCLPNLAAHPATIAFQDIASTQTVAVGPKDAPTLHTYGTAHLERVAPCGVTFDDVAELNASTGLAFVPEGDLMVAKVKGYATSVTGDYYCGVEYSIELYVHTANLADYGVRNFAEAPGQTCGG